MTLEFLHVIRDYNIHLHYQLIHVVEKTWSMHWLNQ